MRWRLTRRDLLFLIDTLTPESSDRERTAERIAEDEELIATMLDDDQLFRRLTTDEEVLVHVSPWLFFTVLLRHARRDMQQETFTLERRARQRVLLFDTDQVIQMLGQDPIRDYLATLLASFTRVESITVPVQMRKGVWRYYRTSNLDLEGLIRYCQTLDKEFRFETYKRIGDVCLFFTGMFPDYIDAQHLYPYSRKARPRARSRIVRSHEDYESHGRAFFRLAAEHERAKLEGLDEVLATISENFYLAEKPLAFLANRYLGFARQRLFDV
jgi:hypothetical protein